MIAGVGVGAYILYRMMKKNGSETSQRGGQSPSELPGGESQPEDAPFDALDYAKNQFGVDDATGQEIVSKANYILNLV